MRGTRMTMLVTTVAALVAVSPVAIAQAEESARNLANNESIFFDGKSLSMAQRATTNDVSAQISELGARELGPAAIIFRSGDKLYIVDVTADARARMLDHATSRGLRASEIARQAAGSGLRDDEIARQVAGSRLRDDEIARQVAGSRLRDDEIARQALGSRLRDDEIARRALGSRLRDEEIARAISPR